MKALVVLALLLLAGCGAPATTDTDTATTDATTTTPPVPPPPPCCPDAKVREVQLACSVFYSAFMADRERLAARLPAGYSAGEEPAVRTQVILFECEAVTLDNVTVLRNVHLMTVPVPVTPPENVDGGFTDVFSLETVTDNATLAAVLASWGFPSVLGTFAWNAASPAADFSIQAPGVDYNVQLIGEGSTGNEPFQSEVRYQNGVGAWFDVLNTNTQNILGAVGGTLQGTGAVADLAATPPPVPLQSAKSVVQQTWTFGPNEGAQP